MLLADTKVHSSQNTKAFNGHRDPSFGEIAWQVFTSLTYGAKGLLWFSYWPPAQRHPTPADQKYGDGIIQIRAPPEVAEAEAPIQSWEYVRSAHYAEAKKINSIVLAWSPLLIGAKSTSVHHVPDSRNASGTAAQLEGSMLSLLGNMTDCDASGACGHYLVGEFALEDGRRALLLHNHDPFLVAWPTAVFRAPLRPEAVLEVDSVHGRESPVLDDSPLLPGLQLRLDPGMARFFVAGRAD